MSQSNPLILAALQNLKEIQEACGYKPAWIYHELVKRYPALGLAELRECAKLLNYKPGWAWYKWRELSACGRARE